MSIREKTVNGSRQYEVSVGLRSKIRPSIRAQKIKRGILTLREAQATEKQLLKDCTRELLRLEGLGVPWGQLLDRWELAHKRPGQYTRKLLPNYVEEVASMLRTFTKDWLELNCQDITPINVRVVLNEMDLKRYSKSRIRAVKSGITTVFKWGLQEGEISGISYSPAQFVKILKSKDEKPPAILKHQEISTLLAYAKLWNHPWYPVWFVALNTGMRSGELYALEWSDVDFENRMISVSKSFNNKLKMTKSTKNGYWRKVPMNADLEKFLLELRKQEQPVSSESKFVLPRVARWKNGEAAKYLRRFCLEIGISPVHFHALRACFATHLLNMGKGSPMVMRVCGWSDEKTMGRYIRLAGIDITGGTDGLSFVIETPPDREKIELMVELRRRNRNLEQTSP